jgi:hypothetical protein
MSVLDPQVNTPVNPKPSPKQAYREMMLDTLYVATCKACGHTLVTGRDHRTGVCQTCRIGIAFDADYLHDMPRGRR